MRRDNAIRNVGRAKQGPKTFGRLQDNSRAGLFRHSREAPVLQRIAKIEISAVRCRVLPRRSCPSQRPAAGPRKLSKFSPASAIGRSAVRAQSRRVSTSEAEGRSPPEGSLPAVTAFSYQKRADSHSRMPVYISARTRIDV